MWEITGRVQRFSPRLPRFSLRFLGNPFAKAQRLLGVSVGFHRSARGRVYTRNASHGLAAQFLVVSGDPERVLVRTQRLLIFTLCEIDFADLNESVRRPKVEVRDLEQCRAFLK